MFQAAKQTKVFQDVVEQIQEAPFNGIARRPQYPRPQYGALMTTYVVLPPA